jgi:hypothetical protein
MDFTQPTVSTGEVAEEWSSNLEDCLGKWLATPVKTTPE